MDTNDFWALIDRSAATAVEDQDVQAEFLREQLRAMGAEAVRGFQAEYDRARAAAYTWDLWGAAYLITGGCSDDGFEYFRAWLIGRGRRAYDAALADPDSLAALCDPERDDYDFEDLGYAAYEAYRELTGSDEWPGGDVSHPSDPAGENWDFDDDAEMASRYPKLWAQRSD